MPGKFVRLKVWLLGLLVGIATAGAFGIQEAGGAEPQTAVGSRFFGFTITDIYDRGVMVREVDLGSPAAQAGIRRDDVILTVNGMPVWSTDDFLALIRELAGRPAFLEVSRMGKINTFIFNTR